MWYFRLVFINLQFVALILMSQIHNEINLVELVYLVIGLALTRLKTYQGLHSSSEDNSLLTSNITYVRAFHKYFKAVFIFQVSFHGVYLLAKVVLVFYLFQTMPVDLHLETFLDIHD